MCDCCCSSCGHNSSSSVVMILFYRFFVFVFYWFFNRILCRFDFLTFGLPRNFMFWLCAFLLLLCVRVFTPSVRPFHGCNRQQETVFTWATWRGRWSGKSLRTTCERSARSSTQTSFRMATAARRWVLSRSIFWGVNRGIHNQKYDHINSSRGVPGLPCRPHLFPQAIRCLPP